MKDRRLSNIWLLNIAVLSTAILLIAKLGYLQIMRGPAYRDKADAQYLLPPDGFDRGQIFFQEKTGRKITAATVVPDYALAIDPSKISNPSALADKLLPFVKFDKQDFLYHAKRANSQYEEIAKHLSESEIKGVQSLKASGIILKKDKKRFYPGEKTAAQVLGFVGSDGSTVSGRYGLERYYNETLSREANNGASSFFADLFLKPGSALLSNRERQGDIVTTIEPTVQGFLERVLEQDVLKKYNAVSAGGIIMDPITGAIYAMGTVPSFDPNNFSKEKNASVYSNLLVDGVYEMGSIVKPLTMAAGLDAGVITPETTYDDKGFLVINTKKISNYDHKGRGVVPMQIILNDSLNTGAVFIMNRLGKENFRNYFKAFGLGEETGIDLPNEGLGNLKGLQSPRDIEYATASFGQGISMTPIETIRALAALGNGGVLVTPHVVERTEYAFTPAHNFLANPERRVIKKETSVQISKMLTTVVDKALMGGVLKMQHYSIAAKTGTAQIVEDGGYSQTDYLHTFFGYFPSNNPRFIVFLAVRNPRGERYASHTLSLPFMQVTKFLINYYNIPPDR